MSDEDKRVQIRISPESMEAIKTAQVDRDMASAADAADWLIGKGFAKWQAESKYQRSHAKPKKAGKPRAKKTKVGKARVKTKAAKNVGSSSSDEKNEVDGRLLEKAELIGKSELGAQDKE